MNAVQHSSVASYNAVDVARLLDFTTAGVEVQPCGLQPKPLLGFITFYDPGWSIVRMRNNFINKKEKGLLSPDLVQQ